jgi:hypothetical protein
MEVLPELGENVLGSLALEVAELVHATALHGGPRPDRTDGPAQAGVAVDDAEQRRRQAPCPQIVQTPLPRLEGFPAAAEVQGHQLLLPVHEDRHDREHRHADHLARTAHAQGQGIEIEIDEVEVAERPLLPPLQPRSLPTIRETALRESGAALSKGARAPRSLRVLPPARYVARTASLTSRSRR